MGGVEFDIFERGVLVWRALDDDESARIEKRAIPHKGERRSLLREVVGASIPHDGHINFARGENLLLLVARRWPHPHRIFDFVESGESLVEIDREELIFRLAGRQSSEGQHLIGLIDDCPLSWKRR